jgi:hypothetical protein
MKKKLAITLFAILFVFPFCAQAMTFTSDGTIQTNDNWTNVYIVDTPPNHTTVAMTGGAVNDSMGIYSASTLNMSGGNVGGLNANDESLVNISGGSITGLQVFNNATVTLSQNASIYSAVAYSGVINMNGGTITCLAAVGGSPVVNLRGGAITDYLGADSFASINVFGYNLTKTDSGGTFGYGQVSGFWQDGVAFAINFGGTEVYSHIDLIPEPATLLLFSIGALLLRKSHK